GDVDAPARIAVQRVLHDRADLGRERLHAALRGNGAATAAGRGRVGLAASTGQQGHRDDGAEAGQGAMELSTSHLLSVTLQPPFGAATRVGDGLRRNAASPTASRKSSGTRVRRRGLVVSMTLRL